MTGARARSGALIVLACGMSQICVTLDYMALTVALPAMSKELHVTTSSLQWALSAYLLAFAALLIVGGRLGDIYGRKKLLLIGLAIFGGASFLGGIAPSVGMLVLARALQGVGAAMFFPATLAITRSSVAPDKVAKAIGTLVAISSVGIALGPFIGGALTETLGWRWVFFVNVPIAAIALVLSLIEAPESRDESAVRGIDWGGLVTISGGVVLLTLMVDLGNEWGWLSAKTLGLGAASLVSVAAFALIERRVRDPLIDLHLFANKAFTTIGTVGSVANFMFAMSVLIFSLYFQYTRGLSPLASGMLILPFSLAGAVVGRATGRITGAFGPRLPMTIGLFLTAGSFAVFGILGADTSWAVAVVAMAFMGMGCSGAYSTTNVATVSVVHPNQAGGASGVVFTGLVIFAALAVTSTSEFVESFGGPTHPSAIATTIWIGAAIAAATGVLSLFVVPGRKTYRAKTAEVAGPSPAPATP